MLIKVYKYFSLLHEKTRQQSISASSPLLEARLSFICKFNRRRRKRVRKSQTFVSR